ncbi:response regulator transcription factor [Herbaspirillum seropedicae]|uniref:response regulator transcription factor n=1 Tax=Herbaspirillum seropedicae TaxID=964 RepID=UPI003D980FB5
MYRIAIIEDHAPTNDEFRGYLLSEWKDAVVEQFFDYETARSAIASSNFDLVVTDIDLGPGTDKFGGGKIAKVLNGLSCPFLVVSGAAQPELELLRGFLGALGAWDYLQKPVNRSDFVTQASQAISFTRGNPQQRSLLNPGEKDGATADSDLIIDPLKKPAVQWKGKSVSLSITETRIVSVLVANRGTVVKFDTLMQQINTGKNLPNLRVHIRKIKVAFKDADHNFSKINNKILEGYFWSA